MDKAGQNYWDQNWQSVPNMGFTPYDRRTRLYRDRVLLDLLLKTFDGLPKGAKILEAGCADSEVLPFIATLGYDITGIDYSPNGCEKFKARIDSLGIAGSVECADIFNIPEHLVGSFDAVVSFGLVEHFTDTRSVISALSRFLKPGGRLLTVVPNMHGLVGFVQWIAGPSIYKVHEKVSPERLKSAHDIEVLEADYMLPIGFGVVNFYEPAPKWLFQARRIMVAMLARISWVFWSIDKKRRLPKLSWVAPFSYSIATSRQPTTRSEPPHPPLR